MKVKALGALFLVSALAKWWDSAAFQRQLSGYHLPFPHATAFLIVVAELSLGILLLTPLGRQRESRLLGAGFLVLVTWAVAWAHWNHGLADCGCFGGFLSLSPQATYAKNILCLWAVLSGGQEIQAKVSRTAPITSSTS